MIIEQIAVDKLIPYAKNARTHDDAQVAQIAASIKEFGWTNPILIDGDKGLIAGHGRLMAARKLGDVWILGKHRVMCGDSTSIDAVETLMDGQKADMVFTDPPYGMSYGGGRSQVRPPKAHS